MQKNQQGQGGQQNPQQGNNASQGRNDQQSQSGGSRGQQGNTAKPDQGQAQSRSGQPSQQGSDHGNRSDKQR